MGKLFRVSGEEYFACRHCCDLRYASQREDDAHRLLSIMKYNGAGPCFDPEPELRMEESTGLNPIENGGQGARAHIRLPYRR